MTRKRHRRTHMRSIQQKLEASEAQNKESQAKMNRDETVCNHIIYSSLVQLNTTVSTSCFHPVAVNRALYNMCEACRYPMV